MDRLFQQFSGSNTRVGVVIKPGVIHAVKAECQGKSLKVTKYVTEEFDPVLYNDLKVFGLKLRQVLEQLVSSNESFQLWTSVAGEQFSAHHLKMPEVSSTQLATSALWHFQQNARLDLSQSLFDFALHEKIKSGSESKIVFNGFSVSRNRITEINELYESAGYTLTGITPQYVAWSELFKIRKNAKGVDCLLHIDSNGCVLRVFKGSVEVVSRQLMFGSAQIVELFKKHYKSAGPRELKMIMSQFKLNSGNEQDSSLAIELVNLLNSVWGRLQQTFVVLNKQHGLSIDRVFHCGELSEYPFLNEFVQERGDKNAEFLKFDEKQCNISLSDSITSISGDALALTLCDNACGTNFLFPWMQKAACILIRSKSRVIYITLSLLLVWAGIFYYLQTSKIPMLKDSIKIQQQRVESMESSSIINNKDAGSEAALIMRNAKALISKVKAASLLEKSLDLMADKKIPVNYFHLYRGNGKDKSQYSLDFSGYAESEGVEVEMRLGEFIRDLTLKTNLDISGSADKKVIESANGTRFTQFFMSGKIKSAGKDKKVPMLNKKAKKQ